MANVFQTALKVMGFVDDEEHDQSLAIENSRISVKQKHNLISLSNNEDTNLKKRQPTVINIVPKEFEDVRGITQGLQNQAIITVNLGLLNDELRKRIIDFISGTVYALDGSLMKIADMVYLLAAKGVRLQEEGEAFNSNISRQKWMSNE
jgi:cell division inhibitor SepF